MPPQLAGKVLLENGTCDYPYLCLGMAFGIILSSRPIFVPSLLDNLTKEDQVDAPWGLWMYPSPLLVPHFHSIMLMGSSLCSHIIFCALKYTYILWLTHAWK